MDTILKHLRRKPEFTIQIFDSEYDIIIREVRRFPDKETGGDLFGSFTHAGMPVIWLVSGPGPRAEHHNAEFVQDTEFMTSWQKRLKHEFGIQYIGSWHSHHRLKLTHPSRGDERAAQEYARNHHRTRTVEVIATFKEGTSDVILSPFFYPNAQKAGAFPAQFELKPGESPVRSKLGSATTSLTNVDWNLHAVPQDQVGRQAITSVQGQVLTDAAISAEIIQWGEPSIVEQQLSDYLAFQLSALQEVPFDFDIDYRDQIYMLTISVGHNKLLAIAIEESDADRPLILQIGLIDKDKHEYRDFTKDAAIRELLKEPDWSVKVARFVAEDVQ